MKKNDFLYILADAIQQHEGWGKFENGAWTRTRSVINNNQGNIKDVGQAGITGHDANNFCITVDPVAGKALQIHDLGLKMAAHNTVREIISLYAPPSDGNDTEAYIAAVVAFFKRRNVPITDSMPIADILALSIEIALIVNNGQNGMADWASLQTSIDVLATLMPEFGFSSRYVSASITDADTFPNASPIGNLYALKEEVARPIIAALNEGQKLNCLMYTIFNLPGTAGGVEYGGEAVSLLNPETSFCDVYYQGASFGDYHTRTIFHEFIHSLFTLTGIPDYLHSFLVSHGGYQADLLGDLQAVYKDIITRYKNGEHVVQVAKQGIAIAAADKNPADQTALQQFLSVIASMLKNWLQG